MISPKAFVDYLGEQGIDFFAGVPDSLLKNICAYISDTLDDRHNIITANEGGAVGLAAGYHLATGRIGCVYMQNSGEGNIINPLASLTDKDVYGIPVLLIIGWRGKPGVHDEPQHVKQGKVTLSLLETMGVSYAVIEKDGDWKRQVAEAVRHMTEKGEVYALVIEKDTFEPYVLHGSCPGFEMSREEAIHAVAGSLGETDAIVSTTGMISRELFEFRAARGEGHEKDFLTVGSMGHANQIALGIALQKPDRRIWCFDGDGALIMHMGSMAIVAEKSPRNYVHVVFNNGAHDSVGGQPTVGLDIDIPAIAKAVGYKHAFSVSTLAALREVLLGIVQNQDGPVLLEIKVRKGNRKDLGRPTTTPTQNKEALMGFLKD